MEERADRQTDIDRLHANHGIAHAGSKQIAISLSSPMPEADYIRRSAGSEARRAGSCSLCNVLSARNDSILRSLSDDSAPVADSLANTQASEDDRWVGWTLAVN